MKHKADHCPVCGCEDLKERSTVADGENVFYTYTCRACGETVSTRELYIAAEKQREEQTEKERQEQAEKERQARLDAASAALSAKEIFAKNIDNTLEVLADFCGELRCGSGVLVGGGYIVTNCHVVAGGECGRLDVADPIFVKSNNIAREEVELVYADAKKDLALLRSDTLTGAAPLCKEPVVIGDKIYVIGNSKGEGMCILDGLVSDKERYISGERYILISAPTTTGNSGGPVFNEAGEVVGIVTMGKRDIQSMNYAIPVPVVLAFMRDAADKEGIDIDL